MGSVEDNIAAGLVPGLRVLNTAQLFLLMTTSATVGGFFFHDSVSQLENYI